MKEAPAVTTYTAATARFEAACQIDSLPESSPSSRLHGHGYCVKVRATLPDGWSRFEGSSVEEFTRHVQSCVAPLDHQLLNNILSNPTNENIARWLAGQLEVSADKIAVQSTPYEGVDIDARGNAHVWQQFRFEAAHCLPNVGPDHQCGRMHGHGFKVILHAEQVLGDADMAVNLEKLAELWGRVSPELEYSCLNDIPGLENPTSEHLCAWLWQRLKPKLNALSHVSVYETSTAGCHYDGQHFRIWKDFRFESAIEFKRAPAGEPRRRMHGHSYLTRLHLQAPLDTVLGWTIDYGDVKSRFKPILSQLDHRLLNSLVGLDMPASACIAEWIRQRVANDLPELERIDCYEMPGCGAVVSWAEGGPALPI